MKKPPQIAEARCLARPAGFEPTTPWFVGDSGQFVGFRNQRLAALAFAETNLIQSQTRHSQSDLVTNRDFPVSATDP